MRREVKKPQYRRCKKPPDHPGVVQNFGREKRDSMPEDESPLTDREKELLEALEVTNSILEMIDKDMRGESIDVTYPQLSKMFEAQLPKNAALIARIRR